MTARAKTRLWYLALLAIGVLGSLGASGTLVNTEVALGGLIAAVGAWAVLALKRLYDKLTDLLDVFPDVLTALWGPRDASGNRRGGGLVDGSQRIERKVDELGQEIQRLPEIERKFDQAAATAETAREAVTAAQNLIQETLKMRLQ